MLDQICQHGFVDLKLHAQGGLEIDAHHTVEDIGITLGQSIQEAIGDKKESTAMVMSTFHWMNLFLALLWIFRKTRT